MIEMPKPKKIPQITDFLGKSYTLSHSENYENFLQELGVKKNTRNHAVKSKPTVTLSQVNEEEYLLDTSYPEGRRVKVKFKVGEEIQRRRPNGCPTISIFCIHDNKLIERQCTDDRGVFIEREFGKDYLNVMMEVNDVKCYRYYKVKASEHSVTTETSRRYPIWDGESESEKESTPSVQTTVETIPKKDDCEDEFN